MSNHSVPGPSQSSASVPATSTATSTTKSEEYSGNFLNKMLLRVKYSFYSALVFFLFANPETYKIIQKGIGRYVAYTDAAGVPTAVGFFAQTGLFFLTILGLMMIPNL
jgi:hypothetical protein